MSDVTAQEMNALRSAVDAMRKEHRELRPDLERLRRALWGEENARSAYKGFFHDFDLFRENTQKEFEHVHKELRDVWAKLESVSGASERLITASEKAKHRGERISKWALVLVPLIILAVFNLIINIFQW